MIGISKNIAMKVCGRVGVNLPITLLDLFLSSLRLDVEGLVELLVSDHCGHVCVKSTTWVWMCVGDQSERFVVGVMG